jgi:hypothetical protein
LRALSEPRSISIWWICLGGFAFVLLNALQSLPHIADLLLKADGDDQMRLVEVRDWLAGQGWFDMRQYRVLPPEGISMHWSRYIDVGIAAFLVPASWVLSTEQAEFAAVILWPSFLACCMVLVLAHGTSRLFGKAAALGALAVFLSWGKLGGEFVPPRIDHHNVQILCSTAVFFLSLVPGRGWLLGALAGALTVLALAVGLEMLPFLALVWAAVALRHAFDQPQTGDWLLGFGAAFTLTAPLLFIGQTPPAEWWINHCDELAPPVLLFGAVGVAATVVPVLAQKALRGPVLRILAMTVIAALGLWLAAPVLGVCLAGPYANVSPQVREHIANNIIEALSATTLLQKNPILLARVLLPPVLICLLAAATAWNLRDRLDRKQAIALIQSFALAAVGLIFATQQIRAANLMAPTIPLFAGFLLYAFTLIPRADLRLRVTALIVLVLALPTVVENISIRLLLPFMPKVAATETPRKPASESNCRNAADMARIDSLPKSVILSTVNLGPAIVTYTRHSTTSASYHRSDDAYRYGFVALRSEPELHDALSRTHADYVVLCPTSRLELDNPYTKTLLAGDLPDWLTDVTTDREGIRILQVDKSRLPDVSP